MHRKMHQLVSHQQPGLKVLPCFPLSLPGTALAMMVLSMICLMVRLLLRRLCNVQAREVRGEASNPPLLQEAAGLQMERRNILPLRQTLRPKRQKLTTLMMLLMLVAAVFLGSPQGQWSPSQQQTTQRSCKESNKKLKQHWQHLHLQKCLRYRNRSIAGLGKITKMQLYGVAYIIVKGITIINHIKAIDYFKSFLSYGSLEDLSAAELVTRFQQNHS